MMDGGGEWLSGRTALVTGGGRGIGQAVAVALAGAGARVAVAARSGHQLDRTVDRIRDAGGEAFRVVADVTAPSDIGRMVGETEDRYGPVDVLVNNAAQNRTTGPIWEVDADAWSDDLRALVDGPFRCARAVLSGMVERGRGRIINVVSAAGLGPSVTLAAYSVGKTALIRFTEVLALQLAGSGVSAFAMDPGFVHTSLVEQAAHDRWTGPEFRGWLEQGLAIPAERAGGLAATLASGRYDRLTGWYVSVHDDLDALVARRDGGDERLRSLRIGR